MIGDRVGVDGFATIEESGGPLPVIVVGAGRRGRHWIGVLRNSSVAGLAGVVDLDPAAAEVAAATYGEMGTPAGSSLPAMLEALPDAAVIDVTVPAAHVAVARAALSAGRPVLTEKPLAATLADGLSIAAISDVTHQLVMVAQTRRWSRHAQAMRDQARAMGPVAVATASLYRECDLGPGFRQRMAHPVLFDLAVHGFDTARFILESEPVAVACEEFNPRWSTFAGNAVTIATFEMSDGARFTYTGNWCEQGGSTSWNGVWRLSAEGGSVEWDGATAPVPDGPRAEVREPAGDSAEGSAGILVDFVRALRTGTTPMCEVHDNLASLAMVEAAVESSATGRRVHVPTVVQRARRDAIAQEEDPSVREALASLTTAGELSDERVRSS